MSILDKLKKAQAPKPQYVMVYGRQALIIDVLSTQYYVQHIDGKREFAFKSDTQVKLCKAQI